MSESNIKMSRKALAFIAVLTGDYGKSVHISQEVTKTYPGGRGGNSRSVAVFSDDKFGEGQEFTTERHMLVKAPKTMSDAVIKADFIKWMKANPQATIYRILSHNVEDVLTEEQLAYGKTIEEYQDDLLVRASDGTELKGTPMYRQYFLSDVKVDDIDLRGKTATVQQKSVSVASAKADEVVEELAF